MNTKKLVVLIIVIALVGAFFIFDLGSLISLERFKAQQDEINALVIANPVVAGSVFFVTYVVMAGLSLPGAAIMTLVGGALFGLVWGVIIVSFASTMGATLAFLVARFILRDTI